jgi:hypothetical protein
MPNSPLRWTSGAGGAASLSSACGGGDGRTGAGRVSHFIE